jgi:exodeoxyribonuclease VII large subunit
MAGNLTEYSVSELSFALKRTIEDAYGLVRVRGEISGFKRAASGHSYLCLKDDRAVLDAVMWKTGARRMSFQAEDGLEVVCTGTLTTYPGRSKYQLIIEHMEPAGAGALMALLEERKKKLAAEGLFDPDRKRPLPFLPGVIGVVTSPTGAVIRDILHRIDDRFPRRVIVAPVPVQGEGAAQQIAAAIASFCRLDAHGEPPRPDVLIVARGGGSIEDLWAFNEEIVARAVASCTIPLISAVGHETDTTLIDLVADRRAPTPTAAAEMAVPVRRELLQQVDGCGNRLSQVTAKLVASLQRHVDGLARGLPEPRLLINHAGQRLDDQGERLVQAVRTRLHRLDDRVAQVAAGLRPPGQVVREAGLGLEHCFRRLGDLARDRVAGAGRELRGWSERLAAVRLEVRVSQGEERLAAWCSRLTACTERKLKDAAGAVHRLGQLLDSLGPERVLARGYAIVRNAEDRHVLSSKAAAEPHRRLAVQFVDGSIEVMRIDAPARPRPKPVERVPAGQESLL